MSMHPIAYTCEMDDSTAPTIQRCPKFVSCIGDKPAYWYLTKKLYGFTDYPNARALVKVGFRNLYWNGSEWHHHTPKQFPAASEAFQEYVLKIRDTP